MKRIFSLILLLFLAVSCAKDVNYYEKHPDKAREKLEKCTLDIFKFEKKEDKAIKECEDAYNGLVNYTTKKYSDKSHIELTEEISKHQCGLISIDPECSTLKELQNKKYEEHKEQLKQKIQKELTEKYNSSSYNEIYTEYKKYSGLPCYDTNDECLTKNFKQEILKELKDTSYKNYLNKLKESEIARYKKMSLEDFSKEYDRMLKEESNNFFLFQTESKTAEEEIKKMKLKIVKEYAEELTEKGKKNRYAEIIKKYENYSFKNLIPEYNKIKHQFRQNWFTTECLNKKSNEYETGIFCDIMKEESKAIDKVFIDTRKKAIDKEYNSLKSKYKNETWNKFMTTWITQNKYTIYDYEELKKEDYYDRFKDGKTDITAIAMTKLYFDKEAEGYKELSKIPTKELLSQEKKYCYDTRRYSACSVFKKELKNRQEKDLSSYINAFSNVSLDKVLEMDKASKGNYYDEIIKDKALKQMKNMNLLEADRLITKITKVTGYNNVYSALVEELSNKERKIINTYINNPSKIKEVVNKCYKIRRAQNSCRLQDYPYLQVRKAMSELGSYTNDQLIFEAPIK